MTITVEQLDATCWRVKHGKEETRFYGEEAERQAREWAAECELIQKSVNAGLIPNPEYV